MEAEWLYWIFVALSILWAIVLSLLILWAVITWIRIQVMYWQTGREVLNKEADKARNVQFKVDVPGIIDCIESMKRQSGAMDYKPTSAFIYYKGMWVDILAPENKKLRKKLFKS